MAKTTPLDIDRARAAALDEALEEAEEFRFVYRIVAQARRVVTALGPDDAVAWDLALAAADLECAALNWASSRLSYWLAAIQEEAA